MKKTMTRTALAIALATAFAVPTHAARHDADGLGQALIYPYYTAQGSSTSSFNTYISIANHAPDAKALRVRFREAKSGAEVAAFNLFLARNDMWAGAVVPHQGGARLISDDRSCTEPALAPLFDGLPPPGDLPGITFTGASYSGSLDDGGGTGLDRTREGWIEVIEMGTLAATSLAQATHNAEGFPANCGALRQDAAPNIAAPTGGLSGTLTLIEVNRGFDFTVKAEAIAELSTLPFFRRSQDPYPSFDAGEITAVSVVSTGGVTYRSEWRNGAEAVAAALMRSAAWAEYVLDAGTRSRTDVVLAFPTRYRAGASAGPRAPFSTDFRYSARCGTDLNETRRGEPTPIAVYDRHSAGHVGNATGVLITGDPSLRQQRVCASAAAIAVGNAEATPGSLLASPTLGYSYDHLRVRSTFSNGMLELAAPDGRLVSLPSSTRYVTATGALLSGTHTFSGLPMVGFMVRSFENGTLACAAGSCQGNYGGAFPLSFRRSITP